MNRAKIFLCFFTAILIIFSISLSQKALSQEALSQESAEQLYEAALFKKEAEGDQEGAIKIFRKIIADYPEKRKINAKAQLQIGMCYEKLGLREALKAYKKVIDNYPEQTDEVKEAREKISILLRAQTVVEKGDREFRIRQVWAGPGVDSYGAPSLDGRYLSYVDWKTGDLALLELPTGKKRHLTNGAYWKDPTEYAFYSRISPDNKLVAYSWFNWDSTYDLRLIGIDGSGRRILYSDEDYEVQPADWSSDGKQIAVKRYSNKGEPAQILWVSVTDGSVRVLKTLGEGQGIGECVCHSPDDRFIAYESPVEEDSGNYDIYLLATDGSGEIPLIKHPANDRLLGWARGRKEILFTSDRTGTWDAFLIRVEDGKPQDTPIRIKSEIGNISPMGFILDGSYYFGLNARWFNTYIATLDLRTGKLLAPLSQPIVGSNFALEWSPDGKYLAYISEKVGPSGPGSFDHVLHIHSLKTKEEREVPCRLKRLRNPRWSPDGRSILVTSVDRSVRQEGYNGGLYLIDVQDGKVTASLHYAYGTLRPQEWGTIKSEWSPDGKSIFYITRDNILMRELESGRQREIYRNPNLLMTRNYSRPLALSPDGQRLVFGIKHPKKNTETLLIMPSSGGDARELLKLPKSERIRAIAWTPDGEYVLFTKREKRGTSLWRISPEGGDSQKLWQSEKYMSGLRVHPDGRKIAFSTSKIDKEIWVMENFLAEEKTKKKSK